MHVNTIIDIFWQSAFLLNPGYSTSWSRLPITHICRWYLFTYPLLVQVMTVCWVSRYCLNQCWCIVNWTIWDIFQCNVNRILRKPSADTTMPILFRRVITCSDEQCFIAASNILFFRVMRSWPQVIIIVVSNTVFLRVIISCARVMILARVISYSKEL